MVLTDNENPWGFVLLKFDLIIWMEVIFIGNSLDFSEKDVHPTI